MSSGPRTGVDAGPALRLALTLVLGVEVVALGTARPISPVVRVSEVLLAGTPGPVATWFLGTFRGSARPLLLLGAAGLVVGVAWLGVRIAGRWTPVGRWLRRSASASDGRGTAVGARRPLGRRSALAAGLTVALGVVALRAGTALRVDRLAATGEGLLAARPLPPVRPSQDLSRVVPGLSPVITPIDRFYRIDTSLRFLRIEPSEWRLRVHGMVERELVLSLDDLVGLGLEEHDVTLSCVSNEVGGGLVGTARWTGVPLPRILERVDPLPAATQLVGRSVDGWTAGFPTDLHRTPGAMVAVGMNGEPLPQAHGRPARLVVPGLYGYVSATKWLTELELTTWEDFDGFWVERLWAKEGPVKLTSRVDVPALGARIAAGPVRAAGVAWGPLGGIGRVEVRVDDGPWREATLSDPLDDRTWVQWYADVVIPPGRHDVEVRAYDTDGAVQSGRPRPPLPDGAEGWHRRSVRATATASSSRAEEPVV